MLGEERPLTLRGIVQTGKGPGGRPHLGGQLIATSNPLQPTCTEFLQKDLPWCWVPREKEGSDRVPALRHSQSHVSRALKEAGMREEGRQTRSGVSPAQEGSICCKKNQYTFTSKKRTVQAEGTGKLEGKGQ